MKSQNKTESKGKSASKRNELLDEAARVFNRKGVSQTSLALVAKNVGVSRAALYYYVDDQQDLVYQCYVRSCAQMTALLEAAVANNSTALDMIDEFVASALDDDRPEFASLSHVAFLSEEQRIIVLGLYKAVRYTLADIVADGIERGHVRECKPRIVASIILGIIAWVPVSRPWHPKEVGGYKVFCQSVLDTLKFGVAKQRIETNCKALGTFDLSGFFTNAGNVFDAEDRVAVRRETLFAAASWLFNQKGVDATSLEEIASTVGVTKKVIYHNIGGKDALVTDCYRRSFRFFNYVEEDTNNFSGNRLEALSIGLNTVASASVRKDIAPLLATVSGHSYWSEQSATELNEFLDNLVNQSLKTYVIGAKEGSIRSVNGYAQLLLRPGYYAWMSRWGDSLKDDELALVPTELTKLYCLGLATL